MSDEELERLKREYAALLEVFRAIEAFNARQYSGRELWANYDTAVRKCREVMEGREP